MILIKQQIQITGSCFEIAVDTTKRYVPSHIVREYRQLHRVNPT